MRPAPKGLPTLQSCPVANAKFDKPLMRDSLLSTPPRLPPRGTSSLPW